MRKLAAALACRIAGRRLYGKPLQALDVDAGVSVLDQIIALLRAEPSIEDVVLGIADGADNDVFVGVAERHGVLAVRGSEEDVLQRLILCGQAASATDVFRVTTESPFPVHEMIADVWKRHVDNGNDVTVIDGVPEGCHFEIYTLEALQKSHDRGDRRHRSELCSLYVREHPDEFRVEVVPVNPQLERLDLRLTVDYPEDLVVCRKVYEHFRSFAPRIPVRDVITFLDEHPDVTALVAPYVQPVRLF